MYLVPSLSLSLSQFDFGASFFFAPKSCRVWIVVCDFFFFFSFTIDLLVQNLARSEDEGSGSTCFGLINYYNYFIFDY